MRIVVHSAAIQDRDGAGLVLDKIRRRFPWLELIWADGGYNAWQVDAAVAKVPVLRMEIVKRSDDMKGFVVRPRRWVVERTFSWFGRNDPHRQSFGIDQGVDLAAFHLLAGVVTHCVVFAAPFSADCSDWLSRTAAEGLASRPIRSRNATCTSAQIASHVPSRWNLRKML